MYFLLLLMVSSLGVSVRSGGEHELSGPVSFLYKSVTLVS